MRQNSLNSSQGTGKTVIKLSEKVMEKFEVDLVTVTTIDTYTKLGSWEHSRPAEVRISEPLTSKNLQLMARQDSDNIDLEIRGEWIRQFSKRKDRVFGQFRISDLLHSIYGQDVVCRKLFESLPNYSN